MKMKKEIVSKPNNKPWLNKALNPCLWLNERVKGSLCLSEGLKPYPCLSEGLKPCLCLNEGDYTPHFENCSALKKDLPPYSIAPHTKLFLTKIFSQPLVNQINNVTQNPFLRLKRSFVTRENSPFMSLFEYKILNFWDKNLNFYFTFKHVTN